MSMLAMSDAEVRTIDSKVEQMMDWAKARQAEAEQLALDSARLMACTTDRLDRLQKQNFFMRCWNRFNGDAAAAERANANDVIQMQKTAFRYVNMLQEQQLLMAHSLLSLKNNLISLAIEEKETRDLIANLAQRTLERFQALETRVDQLEISTNLQGWLLGLEERDYDEKYPTPYMRLLRVINDFFSLKNDNWNYNDLMFMRKAIRIVGINPKASISLGSFIDGLIDEILDDNVGLERFDESLNLTLPEIPDSSKFVINNISSPVYVSMHSVKFNFTDCMDIVETLKESMNITTVEALKLLIRKNITNMNVNIDYKFPLAETSIEILSCMRLCEKIVNIKQHETAKEHAPEQDIVEDNKQGDRGLNSHEGIVDKVNGKNISPNDNIIKNAILGNDYAPGGNKAGIFMADCKKLNPINLALADPLLAATRGETAFFHYSPSMRKLDGDEIVLTNCKIIVRKYKTRKIDYLAYFDIDRIIQNGYSITIFDTNHKKFEIELYDTGISNYINGILRDIYIAREKMSNTSYNEECPVSNAQIQQNSTQGETDKKLNEDINNKIINIIRLAANTADTLPEEIYIKNTSNHYQLNKGEVDNIEKLIEDDAILVFDANSSSKIILGLYGIYKINGTDVKGYQYDEIDDIDWQERCLGGLGLEIKDDIINLNIYNINSQFYILNIIQEICHLFNIDQYYTKEYCCSTIITKNICWTTAFSRSESSLFIKNEHPSIDNFNKKINNALKKYAYGVAKDEILVYFDNTLFGGGDEGFIMTYDSIYYCNGSKDKDIVKYRDITHAGAADLEILISDKYKTHKINCTAGDDGKLIRGVVAALTGIISNKNLLLE